MKLTRPRSGAMIGGVCAGLARYLGVDATLVRIAFVLIAIFAGSGVLIYLVLWAVIPREEDGGSLAEEGFDKAKRWYDSRNNPQPPEGGPRYDI
jgi:phage shock protein PspC (stress-responsive transcriptional regulator)